MRISRSPSRCESEATGRGSPASGPPSRSGGRDGRGDVWPRGGWPSTSRLSGRTMKPGRSRDPSWGTAFGRRFGASINSRLLPRSPQLRISRLRRRRDEWIEEGLMDELEGMALEAYDRVIGLELSEVAVDCCITKSPCGGEKAGRSPVERGKRGIKRSVAVDARGIPLGVVSAPANRHDSPLLGQTLDAARASGLLPEGASIHLDRGYDSEATRQRLRVRDLLSTSK